jgi:hypothetical protein
MNSRILSLLAGALLMTCGVDAGAYSLDTGIVSTPDAGSPLPAQVRAGQFVLSDTTIVTSLSHWVTVTHAGLLRFDIYTDVGGLPGSSLFNASASLSVGTDPVWVGPSGLNWSLGAGTYWIYTFPVGASAVDFTVPFCFPAVNAGCIANPTTREARYSFASDSWTAVDGRSGWRVNVANVPEPGTLALLGLGLAGLGLSRRRKA